MALWETPKTDWHGFVNGNGDYEGDRFNSTDYNRIKNNIQYLHDMAVEMYEEFSIEPLENKGVADYPYADEINTIETNLETVAVNTFKKDYGSKIIFYDNAAFIDFNELNRIESATLDLYNKLLSQYNGRRMLAFMLGPMEVFGNGSF